MNDKNEHSIAEATPESKKLNWAGYILSALPIAFLLLDGIMKLC